MYTPWRCAARGVVADSGGEIANPVESLVRLQQRLAQSAQIEPAGAAQPRVAEAVVEVEPVDVGDHSFGSHGLGTALSASLLEGGTMAPTPPG